MVNYILSEAGTRIEATVRAEAPWCCLTANDGSAEEAIFTGREDTL